MTPTTNRLGGEVGIGDRAGWRDDAGPPHQERGCRRRRGSALVALGALLAGARPARLVLPAARSYGPPGSVFHVSFVAPPSETGVQPAGGGSYPDVAWTDSFATSPAGSGGLLELVSVWHLRRPMTHQAAMAYLRRIFIFARPTAHQGLPAVRQMVPCFNPSGSCPGWVGGLDVVDGATLYTLQVSGADRATTAAVLASFST